MKKSRRGWLVNVASTAAVRGEAFHSHYAAARGPWKAMTKSWRLKLAPYNILVKSVAPGW
jgi:3-oxoacyl-[acyl-carrier protein] reductase